MAKKQGGQLSETGRKAIEIAEKYPSSSTNSLAKALYEANPLLFNSKEHARKTIAFHRGG